MGFESAPSIDSMGDRCRKLIDVTWAHGQSTRPSAKVQGLPPKHQACIQSTKLAAVTLCMVGHKVC
ncbi:hypothetical protein HaLaN_09408, partial [Haematococcus lacustris]